VVFAHQKLTSNRLTYLVHAKSIGELISFGFSDHSVRHWVSVNRWVIRRVIHFLADLWSQSKFRTQRKSQRKTDPKCENDLFNDSRAIHDNICNCFLIMLLSYKQINKHLQKVTKVTNITANVVIKLKDYCTSSNIH